VVDTTAEEPNLVEEAVTHQADNTDWGFRKDRRRREELVCIGEALGRIHPHRDPVHVLLHSLG
jgi:hypothetical protein